MIRLVVAMAFVGFLDVVQVNSAGPDGKCTEEELTEKKCSENGYLCPFVECGECKPCEKPSKTLYTSGNLKGCTETEECVKTEEYKERDAIKVDCDENCYTKGIIDGKGPNEGCRMEICQKKPCPPKPEESPCQKYEEAEDQCGCAIYIKKPSKNPCEKDQCFQERVVDGQCVEECKPLTGQKTCNKECEKEEVVEADTDTDQCTKQVRCVPKTCEDLAKDKGQCVIDENTENTNFGPECQCKLGETPKMKTLCNKCAVMECILTFTCPEPVDKCDKKYLDLITVAANPIEKKHCNMETKKECLCTPNPESCADGMESEVKPCPLTEEDCKKDEECCNIKCPKNTEGIREHKTCVPANCEVCPDMKGAKLPEGECEWNNEEYCNADKKCCCGCKDASAVEACPAEWTNEKKGVCKCKDAK